MQQWNILWQICWLIIHTNCQCASEEQMPSPACAFNARYQPRYVTVQPLDHYFLIIRSEVGRCSFAIRLGYRGRCDEQVNKNYLFLSKDAQNQGRSPLVRMFKTRQKLKDGQAVWCTSSPDYQSTTLLHNSRPPFVTVCYCSARCSFTLP